MYQQTFKASLGILKRIWTDYIRKYKRTYFLVLLLMVIAQAIVLVTPLITSTILDDHLSNISKEPWYQAKEKDKRTVLYNGSYYKQERYFDKEEIKGEPLTILLIEDDYYSIPLLIEQPSDAKLSVSGSTLTIKTEEQTLTYEGVIKLSKADVKSFYHPTKQPLLVFLVLLVVVTLAGVVIGRFQRLLMQSMNVKILRDARKDASRKLQHLPMEYYEHEPG